MITTPGSPAVLAAQSVAVQQNAQQQRADAQPATVDQQATSPRVGADRQNGATETQTRQSVSATDTRDTSIAGSRSDRAPGQPAQGASGNEGPGATPPAGSGRGSVVDIYA